MANLILLNDGLKLKLGDEQYHIDGKRLQADYINLISHAHSDHIPDESEVNKVVCSKITADLVNMRSKTALEACDHPTVELLDSGHILGARMFKISTARETLLYTGDFSTKKRYFTEGAKPKRCDSLVLECTFGKEEFRFPKLDDVLREMRDWIDDNFIKDRPVLIFAYSLGKAQELLHYFSDYNPYVAPSIWGINKVLEKHNITFRCRQFPDEIDRMSLKEPEKNENVDEAPKKKKKSDYVKLDNVLDLKNRPFLMIASPQSRNLRHVMFWLRRGMATCAASGWAISPSFKYSMGVERAFPISDHADYDELIEFVKGCSPKKVYCWHGYATHFAVEVKEKLGIDALPLFNKQTSLGAFF